MKGFLPEGLEGQPAEIARALGRAIGRNDEAIGDMSVEKSGEVEHDPRHDFDTRATSVGRDDGGPYRLPRTDVELCRVLSAAEADDPGRKLCSLTINNAGLVASLVGLDAADLRRLARFFEDYEHRLRNF